MDPVWNREFPDTPEQFDDSLHVGEHGRQLLRARAQATAATLKAP
jgi:hypothetical protein